MEEQIYIGRQPILDRKQKIVAYELLFRSGSVINLAEVTDDIGATSRVLSNALNHIGVDKLIGNKKAYVNVDHHVIKSGFLGTLDPTRFVIELLEDIELDEEVMQKVIELRANGYTLALDDFVFQADVLRYFKPVLPYISIVKVDLKENPLEVVQSKIGVLSKYNVKLLAEKVENMHEYEVCMDLGFQLFQGYFFSKPTIIEGRGVDPDQMAVMDLIKVIQKDSEITELEKSFKRYPDMTITLLKFINSAAISTRCKISSVRQAIALLGQKKLFNWLLLMQYAFSGKNKGVRSPLFYMASHRAKTIELLLQYSFLEKNVSNLDEAFLVGLLSLMDALFEQPLDVVLQDLNLGDSVYTAIVMNEGRIGKLLKLIIKMEEDDYIEVQGLLKELNIESSTLTMASMEAYLWAESVMA